MRYKSLTYSLTIRYGDTGDTAVKEIPIPSLKDISIGTDFRFVYLNQGTNLYTTGDTVYRKLTMLANKPPKGQCIILDVSRSRTQFSPEEDLVIPV